MIGIFVYEFVNKSKLPKRGFVVSFYSCLIFDILDKFII